MTTERITQEHARELARACNLDWHRGFEIDNDENRYQALCNAAIQWDREQRAKELPELPKFPYIPPIEQRGAWIKWGQQCAAQARELALEEVRQIAWECCSPDGDDFGNGYNKAAVEITRAIEALKAGK